MSRLLGGRCPRVLESWDAATDRDLTTAARDEIREHASRCADCADALDQIDRLRAAEDPDAARDPGPAYWEAFGSRLAERIEEEEGARRPGLRPSPTGWTGASSPSRRPRRGRRSAFLRSWRERMGRGALLGVAAAVLIVVALVVVERGLRKPLDRRAGAFGTAANAAARDEGELLRLLEQAPPDHVDEALDRYLPIGAEGWSEDLAALDRSAALLREDDLGARAEGDSLYDLFLDLPEEERGRFLKEMRGEIAGSGRS